MKNHMQAQPVIKDATIVPPFEDGKVLGERGRGRYLPRLPDSIIHPSEMDWVPASRAERKVISI